MRHPVIKKKSRSWNWQHIHIEDFASLVPASIEGAFSFKNDIHESRDLQRLQQLCDVHCKSYGALCDSVLEQARLITALPSAPDFPFVFDKENTAGSGSKEPAKKTVGPPSGAMTLSAILSHLETAHYTPVTEVEFERDHWEIKAYSNGQLVQVKVDPLTGAIVPNPPPTIDKPLSAVVKSLEEQGYGPILEIERGSDGDGDHAPWEIEAYKGSSEVKVNVEPESGKITAK